VSDPHTCNSNGNTKINNKVKSVGQECPTHTCYVNPNSKINPNVKGVGQECPTHTCNSNPKFLSSLLIARPRATCSLLVS
jgi:hypothetical protein